MLLFWLALGLSLLAIATWGIVLALHAPLWIAIVVTILCVTTFLLILVVQQVRAKLRASALEAELLRQAAQQADSARPDRRVEVQRIKLLREQAARAEAEAANRAKDSFLAALSHELRTPLTPVLAILSLWKDDSSIPLKLRDDVEMMRRNVELEARLIDDLLDLTRITRGKLQLSFENVSAHQILEQAQ